MNTPLLYRVADAIVKHAEAFDMDHFECGTTACIAGWAVRLELKSEIAPAPVCGQARKLLQIGLKSSNRLFYLDGWPRNLEVEHSQAKTPAERAQIAARRIHYFIATGQ